MGLCFRISRVNGSGKAPDIMVKCIRNNVAYTILTIENKGALGESQDVVDVLVVADILVVVNILVVSKSLLLSISLFLPIISHIAVTRSVRKKRIGFNDVLVL